MAQIHDLPSELLESILQYLPMRDVLLNQRVSIHWRDLIQTSPQLRRQTFLGFVPVKKVTNNNLSSFVCNHKSPAASFCGSSITSENPVSTTSSKASTSSLVHFNPVFPAEGDIIRMRTSQFRGKPESTKSWLDMYLTQPPCRLAEATVYYTKSRGLIAWGRRSSDTEVRAVQVVRSCGVRARDVLETVRRLSVGSTKKWQRIDIRVPGVERV
ncbi:hypothetical protein CLAFUR4_02831 [Fulvia fulva]|nr:hypothetical protein CLAFUR4_02831 [Fulvia fulva]WPV25474.1 hypothetical protein CLAFUW7_02835 [Fulvia fulva]